MSNLATRLIFNYNDYLAWEWQQPTRHEYVRGEVFAMAGTSDRHNDIALNFTTILKAHLRGTSCRTYMSDVQVYVAAADCSFYPDILVTCAEKDHVNRYVKSAPILIIKILSPSTAAYDLGDKFAAYQQLDSLREYVLIDQERIRVQIYRHYNAQWWMNSIGPGGKLYLDSIDLNCPIEMLYEDLSGPPNFWSYQQ